MSDLGEKLLAAADKGDLELVQDLLKQGADINYRSRVGVLHVAAQKGHEEMVCYLMDDGGLGGATSMTGSTSASPINAQMLTEDTGETALHLAAAAGHVSVIRELVWRGLPVNKASTATGHTALTLAIEHGHSGAVQELLKRGTDPNLRAALNPVAVTPLQLASRLGRVDIVRDLLKYKARVNDGVTKSPLHEAILSGNRTIAEFLLEAGADVKWTVDICQTPMQISEDKEDFRTLLKRYENRPPVYEESQKRLSQVNPFKSPERKAIANQAPPILSPDKSESSESTSSLQKKNSLGSSSSSLIGKLPRDSNSNLHSRISSMGSGSTLSQSRGKSGSHGNLTLGRSPLMSRIPLDSRNTLVNKKLERLPRSPSASAIDKPRYIVTKELAQRRMSVDVLDTPPAVDADGHPLQIKPLKKQDAGGGSSSQRSLSSSQGQLVRYKCQGHPQQVPHQCRACQHLFQGQQQQQRQQQQRQQQPGQQPPRSQSPHQGQQQRSQSPHQSQQHPGQQHAHQHPPRSQSPHLSQQQVSQSPKRSQSPHPGQQQPKQQHPGQQQVRQQHPGQPQPGQQPRQQHPGQQHPGQQQVRQQHPAQPQPRQQHPGQQQVRQQHPGQPQPGQQPRPQHPGQQQVRQHHPGQPQPGQQPRPQHPGPQQVRQQPPGPPHPGQQQVRPPHPGQQQRQQHPSGQQQRQQHPSGQQQAGQQRQQQPTANGPKQKKEGCTIS